MQNPTTMTLSPADVQAALAYWLNHQVLKVPVVVEEVRQRSSKASQPGFEVVVRPTEPDAPAAFEESEGTCASSYPAAGA
jgi:hypothetical protein